MKERISEDKIKSLIKTVRFNEFKWEAFANICLATGLDPSKVITYLVQKVINGEIQIDEVTVREYLGLKVK